MIQKKIKIKNRTIKFSIKFHYSTPEILDLTDSEG